MQSVKWVTFGISNALTRTVVHFFPSEGGVTAPYPAACSLRIFGQGIQDKRVVIEGARLSHPDGVRVEDAFPSLKSDQVGIFGLEIEVSTIQPRVDISASSCVVELASKGHSAKFWPKRLEGHAPTSPTITTRFGTKRLDDTTSEGVTQSNSVPEMKPRVIPLLKDSFNSSSVVVVNGSADSFRPPVTLLNLPSTGPDVAETELSITALLPGTASETIIDDETSGRTNFFSDVKSQVCSWGIFRARTLLSRDPQSIEPQAVFVMYRDALTRRPVSVSVA